MGITSNKSATKPNVAAFGSNRYSEEELIAEMGAAFLCGHVGIDTGTIDNSAAYIHHWMQQLRQDKRLIVRTAARAQKAADFILGERNDQGRQTNRQTGTGVQRARVPFGRGAGTASLHPNKRTNGGEES